MSSELIARLEAASEGSRELGSEVLNAAGDQALNRGAVIGWEYRPDGIGIWKRMPDPTTSLDAIVALIERKLPGWVLAGLGQSDDRTWHAELREGHATSYGRVAMSSYRPGGRPKTPALALCIAFLRALQHQGEDDRG